jgi:hypothetical protein
MVGAGVLIDGSTGGMHAKVATSCRHLVDASTGGIRGRVAASPIILMAPPVTATAPESFDPFSAATSKTPGACVTGPPHRATRHALPCRHAMARSSGVRNGVAGSV